MLLQLVLSTKVPVATFLPKYTRNQAKIANVLLTNQFFKNLGSSSYTRIRDWKDAASNNRDDNSSTITTKRRSDNAPRATDL